MNEVFYASIAVLSFILGVGVGIFTTDYNWQEDCRLMHSHRVGVAIYTCEESKDE